jgi:beta-xylosidase
MVRDGAVYWHQGFHAKDLYRSTDPCNPDDWRLVGTNCNMRHDPSMAVDPNTGKVWMSYGCGPVGTEPILVQELDPVQRARRG